MALILITIDPETDGDHCPAVFVEMSNSHYEILTKYDLLQAIAHLVEQPQ